MTDLNPYANDINITALVHAGKTDPVRLFDSPDWELTLDRACSAQLGVAGAVPAGYRKGEMYMHPIGGNDPRGEIAVTDLHFYMSGEDRSAQTEQLAPVINALREVVNGENAWPIHFMLRSFTSDNQKYANLAEADRPLRWVVARAFRNVDWTCQEHPEMLLGVPLGMYHCGHCGQMVIAGCFHTEDGDQ